LIATPDARFLDYGHQATFQFRLAPGFPVGKMKVDVEMNGGSLGRFQAAEFLAGSGMSIRLKIPGSVLRRHNVLKIRLTGWNEEGRSHPEAWLLPSSKFDLPRDYLSNLPDLGLLKEGLFPFGLRSDLSDTVVVVPDSENDVAASLFEFAGQLGRLAYARRFSFQLTHPGGLSRQTRNSSHIIAFRVGDLPKEMSSSKALAAVHESVSPWNSEKYLLTITSNSTPALRRAFKAVFSERVLSELEGDTAHIYTDKVTAFRTTPVRQVRDYSYSPPLQAWLRENWFALPMILSAASGLLFVGLRLALAQYKRRKSGVADDGATGFMPSA
jgi:hypothetical protein